MNGEEKKIILLVEDDVIIGMLEKSQLEDIGYSVDHVLNGKEAIKSALNKNYNLILMDIDLGSGIDGTQAAEEILKKKDIPIVFLSSHTEPEIVNRTENITSYGYVVKDSKAFVLNASIKMAFKLFQSNFKIKEMQKKYEAIIESTNDFIWSVDPDDYGLVTFNHGLYKYFQEKRNISITNGMRPKDLFPTKEFVKTWEEYYKKALKCGSFTTEYTTYSETNTLLLTFNTICVDNKIVGISVFGKDITEQVKLQKTILESEMRYKLVFESAPIAIIITSGTDVLYANPAYLSMYGYNSLDEFQNLPPLAVFTPEWKPIILENIKKRAEGLPVPSNYEAECIREDGTRFPVLMYYVRTKLIDEPVTIGFIIDMTNFKIKNNC